MVPTAIVNHRSRPQSPTISSEDSDEGVQNKHQHHVTTMGRIVDDDDYDDLFGSPTGAEIKESCDSDERNKSLWDAIHILSKLASMDSTDYQQQLVENSLLPIQEPQLSKLAQSIHRFHALVANLSRENDHQTIEILELQRELEACKARNTKLETAVRKLHKRNVKLRERQKEDRTMAQKLIDQVQQRMAKHQRNEEEEFLKLATKVQQHEQHLRERSDSNFSDIDGLQDFNENESLSTTASLITDDGVATVRIQRERTWSLPKLNGSNHKEPLLPIKSEEIRPTTSGASVGASPARTNSASAAAPSSSKTTVDGNSNPFAAFLAPKPAQPYTLSFVAPFAMQFVKIPISTSKESMNHSLPSSGTDPAPNIEYAFCVCGYHGFDSEINVKPTLGARLLEIEKKPLNPNWSANEVEEAIVAPGKHAKLTFRNDTWAKKQKEVLNAAIQEQERLHPEDVPAPFLRSRGMSGDSVKANLLGFLNFNHISGGGSGNSGNSPPAAKQEDIRPRTPPDANQNKSTSNGNGCSHRSLPTVVPPANDTPPLQSMMAFLKSEGITLDAAVSSPPMNDSPLQGMIAFLKTNHIANSMDEGVTFDDNAAVAFPDDVDDVYTKPIQEGSSSLKPKIDKVGSKEGSDLFEKIEVKEESIQPPIIISSDSNDAAIPTLPTASPVPTAGYMPTAGPKNLDSTTTATRSPNRKSETSEKFKSSMKSMGKLFAFR